ncbi:acyl-CoA dehydrogenase family protein [Streptomyces formicae]|uniref:Acyl-CoA/acyl-ACP dehydrogenase n=1 Tax=Streptomyces formicae TaxID=1616117 RepID=A0ABY3WT06_9ACTN|nr:acyl-CoA dehydrogenase family protein [Streptomyces formicae]UNM14790.1 acyl-CoA/acyl-ACP dehydrogenase [Streptomyces formicae]
MERSLVDRIRDFVGAELVGNERFFDGRPEVPVKASHVLRDEGLANWWLPRDYGTLGASLEESVDVVAELAYGDAGFASSSFISILGADILHFFGNRSVAESFLGPMARTGGFCATLVSEQAAGSELGRIQTSFSIKNDHVTLNGQKFLSQNSAYADFLVVAARPTEGGSTVRLVVVPRDTPGIDVIKRWETNGLRGTGLYRVNLTDCKVPAANIIPGNGLRLLEAGLNASRILIAACAIGMSRRIRDISMDYARTKELKGSLLIDNAVFTSKIGQIEMLIDVMANQCKSAAVQFDDLCSAPDPAKALFQGGMLKSALAAKMYCGQAGWEVATIGSQMFGGLGYTEGHLIGKLVRDIRSVALVEGGDDVTRDLLFSRCVLPADNRRRVAAG